MVGYIVSLPSILATFVNGLFAQINAAVAPSIGYLIYSIGAVTVTVALPPTFLPSDHICFPSSKVPPLSVNTEAVVTPKPGSTFTAPQALLLVFRLFATIVEPLTIKPAPFPFLIVTSFKIP